MEQILKDNSKFVQDIPISHRCTELEGKEWKGIFPLWINDKSIGL